MRSAVLLIYAASLTLGFGSIPTAAQDEDPARRAEILLQAAEAHEGAGRSDEAEASFKDAIGVARQISGADFSVLEKAYKGLAYFYVRRKDDAAVERVYQERVQVHQQLEHPSWELGIALFDLQGYYAAYLAKPDLDKALQTAEEAVAFYTSDKCTWSLSPDTCDRRLADVQGLMGAACFNAKQYELAEPWLENVLARPDDGVRPAIMLTSLRVYAALKYLKRDMTAAWATAERLERFESTYPDAGRELESSDQQ